MFAYWSTCIDVMMSVCQPGRLAILHYENVDFEHDLETF